MASACPKLRTSQATSDPTSGVNRVMRLIQLLDPNATVVEGVDQIHRALAFCMTQDAKHQINYTIDKFGQLETNIERVNFIYERLKYYDLFPRFLPDKKSNEKSVEERLKGNKLYGKRLYTAAVITYTKSIGYAENNSSELALAYVKRSTALFRMGLFQQCAEDIQRALENNHPQEFNERLLNLQKAAEKREQIIDKQHDNLPKIKAKHKNPAIQCASNSVQLFYNHRWGRHVIATRDIDVGELIAVEKPFISYVNPNEYTDYCHECHALCYNPIPCLKCTQVFFCSVLCRNRATKLYHRYECDFILTIKDLHMGDSCLLPCKLALMLRNSLDGADKLKVTPECYRSDRYNEIHHLRKHNYERDVKHLMGKTVLAALTFHFIKHHSRFLGELNIANKENVLKGFLLNILELYDINGFSICEERNSSIFDKYIIAYIGNGIYSFMSMFNHSCRPNVMTIHYKSTVVVRAYRSIKKNEQLFMSYGDTFETKEKRDRQRRLKTDFFFDCRCEACINDWPTMDYLPINCPADRYVSVDDDLYLKFMVFDVEGARGILDKLIANVRKVESYEPCKRVALYKAELRMCFLIFGNKRRSFF